MGCVSGKEQRCGSRAGCLCMCGLEGVTSIATSGYGYFQWSSRHRYDWWSVRLTNLQLVIYPESELLSMNGMLWRFQYGCRRLGRHNLERVTGVDLHLCQSYNRLHGILHIQSTCNTEHLIQPVGLRAVRTLQRCVRGRKRRLAVAMAFHARLGSRSALAELGADLVRHILHTLY